MKRYLAWFCVFIFAWCGACGSASLSQPGGQVAVDVQGAFKVVEAGGAAVTLTAVVMGGSGNPGVTWALSQGNTNCSPACGTLVPVAAAPNSMAVYTPPATAPTNSQATITARSLADGRLNFVFGFQITPPIVVSITTKLNMQTAGGPTVNLSATITNDVSNAGLAWTLMAGQMSCSPQCGTLAVDPAPSLTAHYTPPAGPSAPTGANAMPTIAAASVADPTKSDSFSFTIVSAPISVMITNKFTTQTVGGPAAMVSAVVNNDPASAGVTWTLTAGGAACQPAGACGTLTPSPSPSFSASYTPPTSAPTGVNASPTITATSVTDTTKSDSFSFNIVSAGALFKGSYAFQLQGFDSTNAPMAMSGSIVSDGMGSITGGEVDVNDNTKVTTTKALSGSYTVDTTFNGIPRLTINIMAGQNMVTLRAALSSDGTRGKIIELDSSLNLNAGTLLQQDPAALAAANPAGSYVFGLDSNAGSSNGGATTGRIVEAGQFTLGAGGAGVTGGVADAGQAGAALPLFGGVTVATITAGAATTPDSMGRGTLTLTINGNANSYAYYVVNAQQLNLIEIDPGGLFLTVQSGTAQLQKTLTASSILGTSVAAITGTIPSNGATSSNVIVGVLSFTSDPTNANNTVPTANFESNAGGNVSQLQNPPQLGAGSVFSPFDTSTGRTVILNTFFSAAGVYLSDSGKGYIIDLSRNSNNGLSGQLFPQAPGPFSIQSDIAGNSIGRAGGSSIPGIPNLDFATTFDAMGGYAADVDFTNANLGVGANGQAQNIMRQGQYTLVDPNMGRGTMSFVPSIFGDFSASQPVIGTFYIVGPHQFVVIGQGPLGMGGDASGIIFFDPQ